LSTKIEWCTETWNPIVGCSKVSPGCDHCYAERMANRLASIAVKDDRNETFPVNGFGKYAFVTLNGKWNGKTYFEENELQKPFLWKKPRQIFVVSMGDLFHESIKDNWRNKVLDVMLNCPQHTFIILTKRPYYMADFFYYY